MAALGYPGKMAALSPVSGPEHLGEYVQVVVGEDGDPGQVVVVQEDGAMQAAGLTPELLQSIAHSDTVFYVQPDGSLVAGGSLAEVTGRGLVGESVEPEGGGLVGEIAAHSTEEVRPAAPTPPSPAPVLKNAAQQLRTVAHHVALIQGDSGSVSRLLNHKQLKSICVQVPGLQTKKSADPVVLNAGTAENMSVRVNMNSANPSLLGAQIVQIKSLSEPGQQFLVNTSSLEAPIQVLIRQAQLSSAKAKIQDPNKNTEITEPLDEQRCCAAHPQHDNRTSNTAEKTQKKSRKRKKSVKIKTRSGRISRPPKHKAKDYKFLKVGDLIQGSSSDSEDYSELSTEEEEGGKKESAPRDLLPNTVKNALFQCETCEKSYMGKGGLSRHYRLYPTHGQMDPQFVSDTRKHGDAAAPSEQKKPIPRPRKRLLEDPQNPDASKPPTLAQDGLEFVSMKSKCLGRRQTAGRKYGRPRKILAIGPSEQYALNVKELIQQCEDANLKEEVAPSFTKLLSVYEFLLIKVKQDHPDKPLFPHVYKEFEKLHSMVKVLAQEYVSDMVLSTEESLEVIDSKVAESLGISEEMVIKVSPAVSSLVTEDQNNEPSGEELMPPSKRLKMDEPESGNSAEPRLIENTPVICQAEQSEGSGCQWSPPANATASDAAGEGTEQVTGTAQQELMEEDSASLHAQLHLETEQELLETSHSLLSTTTLESPENSEKMSCDLPEDTLSDGFQAQVSHEDMKEVTELSSDLLPPSVSHTSDLVSDASTIPGLLSDNSGSSSSVTISQTADPTQTLEQSFPTALTEETYSDASHIPPVEVGEALIACAENIDADQCAPDFSLNHGHDLVFFHSVEETIGNESVVIFDNSESTNTNLDTMVALVEMEMK